MSLRKSKSTVAICVYSISERKPLESQPEGSRTVYAVRGCKSIIAREAELNPGLYPKPPQECQHPPCIFRVTPEGLLCRTHWDYLTGKQKANYQDAKARDPEGYQLARMDALLTVAAIECLKHRRT